MSDCWCTANYQCLSCERADNKFVIKVERKRPTPSVVAQCGTRSGYKRHRRDGEDACAACKAAQSAGVKRWQANNPLRHNLIKERQRAK